jgi:hypothetical protein
MTLNATRYFSNSIVGQPQVGADINILETNALPKYNVVISTVMVTLMLALLRVYLSLPPLHLLVWRHSIT